MDLKIMKKTILQFLLVFPVFLFMLLFGTVPAASAACGGSLDYPGGSTCNTTYGNHKLNASWDVTPTGGNDTCNVFIRGEKGDEQINGESMNGPCSGSKTITSYKGAPLTNDANLKLFVSNGYECMNQQVDEVTIPCTLQAPACDANAVNMTVTPSQGTVGSQMKFSLSGSQGSTFVEDSWSAGVDCAGGFWGDKTCNATSATTNGVWTHKWKNCAPNNCSITSAQCSKTQSYKVVGGGATPTPGTCPPDSKLTVSPNPANIGATMYFQYQAGEDVYIGGDTWNPPTSVSACQEPGTPGNPLEDRRYICTASSATNNGVWNHYWGQPKVCGSATYTISGGGATPTPTPTPVTTATPAPTPTSRTVSFRVAESLADLSSAQWQPYTADGMIVPYEIVDKTPGIKTIFVQFKDSDGRTTTTTDCPKCQAQIRLLGEEPAITGCSLSFETTNTILNLTGQNFGTVKGTVRSNETALAVRDWKDGSVKAVFPNAPVGEILPVTLTTQDGQIAEGQCSAISLISVGAKVFCRTPATRQTDNVALALAGFFQGGTLFRQTVSIDKDGIIQGLNQKVESGKNYGMSLKAPLTLRKATSFTAAEGMTNIPNFILPVGDVFPIDGGDGAINSLDKGELNRQFVVAVDKCGRTADFNKDCRVNSIDWACMRFDFGTPEDPEPKPGANQPSPTPTSASLSTTIESLSSNSTPTPTTTTVPAPTPTPTPSPTPPPVVDNVTPFVVQNNYG